jgi:hypothetical protein
VRIFDCIDPATGKQLILTGSATTEADAIARATGPASRSQTTPQCGRTARFACYSLSGSPDIRSSRDAADRAIAASQALC